MRLFPRAAKPDGTTILHYRKIWLASRSGVIILVTTVNGFISVSTTHHHVRLDGGRSHDQDTREGLAGYSAFPVGLFVRGSPASSSQEQASDPAPLPRPGKWRVQDGIGLSRRLSIRGVARGDLGPSGAPPHIGPVEWDAFAKTGVRCWGDVMSYVDDVQFYVPRRGWQDVAMVL
ncbi:hypothetical protein FPV67DRAFT_1451100 [Lyophyllum atratum]|nr:hypothetical protein FPV67DRAFT_1451100 [Lyophyllum atratum]